MLTSRFTRHLLIACCSLAVSSTLFAGTTTLLSDDDQRFLLLRDAALKGDSVQATKLASQLAAYSIPSYVRYYQLRARLSTASPNEINDFLLTYTGSAIADRLRNDWLLLLARQNNWSEFDAQYAQFVLNDDVQVKCYALLSKLKQGHNIASEARTLLTSSRVYGEGCYPLYTNLIQSGQFSHTDMWNQIRWSADANTTTVAIVLAELANLDKTAKALAIPTNKKPEKVALYLEKLLDKPLSKSEEAHQIALILLGRLAKIDPDRALHSLNKFDSKLDSSERAQAWEQIALAAAQKLQPEAPDYWKNVRDITLSQEAYQWRVRSALRITDWATVKAGIQAMPMALKTEPVWVYWLGRAYVAENKPDTAQVYFESITNLPNFYGQLALEERGLRTTIPASTPIQPDDLITISNNPGFQRALQFYALNLRFEGTREWNWQLRSLSERQLLAAAEFARQNELLDRMVSTSDKTKTAVDFTQRFPTPHKTIMQQTTESLGLDMAWVYGLIRQESRFILNAHSNVGASGLMQVMPGTARYVVKKMKMDSVSKGQLNEIETNITLGTNYLNIVLTSLNGSQVLASAGYNAGPSRAKAWRANLPKTVEGAIFTETIPYPETRDYVKNVLSNATYYSALFLHTPQSLKARLGSISPSEENLSDSN